MEGGIRGAKTMNFRYFFDRHVYEPILIKQVAFDREWTGYLHMFVTFENSKIIGGYRSWNMGVQTYKNKSLFATAIEARRMRNFLEE